MEQETYWKDLWSEEWRQAGIAKRVIGLLREGVDFTDRRVELLMSELDMELDFDQRGIARVIEDKDALKASVQRLFGRLRREGALDKVL